jgi:hypothetical protein
VEVEALGTGEDPSIVRRAVVDSDELHGGHEHSGKTHGKTTEQEKVYLDAHASYEVPPERLDRPGQGSEVLPPAEDKAPGEEAPQPVAASSPSPRTGAADVGKNEDSCTLPGLLQPPSQGVRPIHLSDNVVVVPETPTPQGPKILEGTNDYIETPATAPSAGLSLVPQVAGLLGDILPVNAAVLEQGLERFLDTLNSVSRTTEATREGASLAPWLIGAMLTTSAWGMMHRHLGQRRSKDGERDAVWEWLGRLPGPPPAGKP